MYNICLISPNKSAFSETFIKAHKDRLAGNMHFLYGGYLPVLDEDDRALSDILIEDYYAFLKNTPARYCADRLYKLLPHCIYTRTNKHKEYIRVHNASKQAALKHYLQKKSIDCVLAEYGPTGALVSPVCKELGIPLVVHFHGFDASDRETLSAYRDAYEEMFDYADSVIAVSSDMKAALIDLKVCEKKIFINPYGPNEKFLKVAPDYASPNLVAVGRFVDKKAPYFTLQAFAGAYAINPGIKLIMIGDGELLNTCKNLAEYMGISAAVEFMGVASHQKVTECIANSFCFLQHSLTAMGGDSEGTPVAVLEASAAGLPVIATRHAGIKDVIIHDVTGFLVAEKNVDGMAQYIAKLAADRTLAKNMGLQGKAFIRNNFILEKHIHTLNILISSAIKNKTTLAR